MVDITVRPETGTGFDFYAMNYAEEAVGRNAHVRYNAEPVAPDVADRFADTLQTKAADQQTAPNGVNFSSTKDRGMETVFSWVSPEDRSADKKGNTFVGAIYFGDTDSKGLNRTVISYALFETPDGPKVDSQVGIYTVGVPTDYLGSLTENERPGQWFEPQSYNHDFAGRDIANTPVTNAELGIVLDYANPESSVDASPAALGFEAGSSNSGIDASPAAEIGGASFDMGGGVGAGPAGSPAA
jgi:hypothetical protein